MPRIGRRVALFGFFTAMLLGPALAEPPKFAVDPTWPQTLPDKWIIGTIGGIYVDKQDHVWINQRPSSLDARERRAATDPTAVVCCVPAPPVIEFDQNGKVVQGWGGDGPGYKWGNDGHGIFVDHNNFVWVGDNIEGGGHIYKFTRDGKFVMRLGKPGTPGGSNDIEHFNRPADMVVDPETNEIFVADGYTNHRVIVFDAATGAYKRHWGAYGKPPTDEKDVWDPKGPPPSQLGLVHCITMTKEGLVLVCDRSHNRMQMFRKDGTFVREISVLPQSAPGTIGSISAWPDAAQTYLLVVDDPNGKFHVIDRASGNLVGSFGRVGHQIGEFYNLHFLDVDSKGNVYTAEVQGKRLQKFRNLGGL
jgi:NHL repeat